MTLAEAAGINPGPNARLVGQPGSRQELDTPALLIELDALEANIEAMAAHCRTTGQRLRPHTKTHKSVEIARRQVAAGAVGVCCATLGEAEFMGNAGIPGVHITSPVVRPNRIARLMALNAAADGLATINPCEAQINAPFVRVGRVSHERRGVSSGLQHAALPALVIEHAVHSIARCWRWGRWRRC